MPGKKVRVFVEGRGRFDLEVDGELDYQDHMKEICGGYTREGSLKNTRAELLYENNNSSDRHAVRVAIKGKTVGYLSSENAKLYRERVRKAGHEGIIVSCNALVAGGKKLGWFKKKNFGVWLDLPIEDL